MLLPFPSHILALIGTTSCYPSSQLHHYRPCTEDTYRKGTKRISSTSTFENHFSFATDPQPLRSPHVLVTLQFVPGDKSFEAPCYFLLAIITFKTMFSLDKLIKPPCTECNTIVAFIWFNIPIKMWVFCSARLQFLSTFLFANVNLACWPLRTLWWYICHVNNMNEYPSLPKGGFLSYVFMHQLVYQ